VIDAVPVPHDIPLALPADRVDLEILIVASVLLHILFVALMVGGAVLTLIYELRGRRDRDLDALALEIAKTVTVNKSLAVVLGVAPLLVMNALYGVHFYSANALTGTAWLAIIPLVALAFLLTYAHKYSWHALAERKGLHVAIGAAGTALFLFIPLIFLANINLMLFPEHWGSVHGFLSTLPLPNVLPRYLHFVIAAVAVTGLFLAGWFGRRGYPTEVVFERLDRATIRREMTGVALAATTLQGLAGPLLLFTLPAQGMSWTLVGDILLGVTLAVVATVLLWRETVDARPAVGQRYLVIVVLLAGTVLFMGYGRHLYRERALAPHSRAMAARTQDYQAAVLGARMRAESGTQREGGAEAVTSPGERIFRSVCMGCHAFDRRLVGPPVPEIASAYQGDPEGLAAWVKAPGRKRADYPEMPPIPLRPEQYREVAEYVLEAARDEQ